MLQSVTYLFGLVIPVPWTSVTFGVRGIQKCCKQCFLLFVAVDAVLVAALKKVWRPRCVYKHIGLLNFIKSLQQLQENHSLFYYKADTEGL